MTLCQQYPGSELVPDTGFLVETIYHPLPVYDLGKFNIANLTSVSYSLQWVTNEVSVPWVTTETNAPA